MASKPNSNRTTASEAPGNSADYGLKRAQGVQAEDALFQRLIDGLVVLVPSNETPLQSLAGMLDWRFHGAISEFQIEPARDADDIKGFRGKPGELTLVPLQHRQQTYLALLVGIGAVPRPGVRPPEAIEPLARIVGPAIEKLGWKNLGLSHKDWGLIDINRLTQILEGRPGLLFD